MSDEEEREDGPDEGQEDQEDAAPPPASANQAGGTERVLDQDIEDELKTSYLTYAMSVIVQRALPDVRDGLNDACWRLVRFVCRPSASGGKQEC